MFPMTLGYIGTQEVVYLYLSCFAVAGLFWIFQIVDVARRQFAEPNLKLIWALVMVFTGFLGALVYAIVGRKQGDLPSQ